MIIESQEKHLASRPNKILEIKPFDPKARIAGNELVKELERLLPSLEIHFGGSTVLGLLGQNDIDINILTTPDQYDIFRPVIEKIFGKPTRISESIKWEFKRDGFDVELYLTDKNSQVLKDQIKVFEILFQNKKLRDEYERIKMPLGKIYYRDYMKKKYEFYNRILGLE